MLAVKEVLLHTKNHVLYRLIVSGRNIANGELFLARAPNWFWESECRVSEQSNSLTHIPCLSIHKMCLLQRGTGRNAKRNL